MSKPPPLSGSATWSRRSIVTGLGALAVTPALAVDPSVEGTEPAGPLPEALLQAGPVPAPGFARGEGFWGYNGGIPGPVLRRRQGERLTLSFENALPQGSTVHWHGIRIAHAMDGVPGLTQPLVPPGGRFAYDFVLPDAGTYWYHPHAQSWEQLDRGLAGALIVEERGGYPVDADLVLLLDDWILTAEGGFDAASLTRLSDWAHAGRIGRVLTVNGQVSPVLPVPAGRTRLRLIAVGNARIFRLRLGQTGWILAADGQPLAQAKPVAAEETLLLAPGQRLDLLLDLQQERLMLREETAPDPLAWLEPSGPAKPVAMEPPLPLPANPLPVPVLPGAREILIRMAQPEGVHHAMMGMETGHGGMEHGGMGHGGSGTGEGEGEGPMLWTLNGLSHAHDTPLFTASLGETVILEFRNESNWPHAMHWHGHHAQVLDGPQQGWWRDTVLIEALQSVRVALVADNSGRWMMHCHMLEHQAGGMMAVFDVV